MRIVIANSSSMRDRLKSDQIVKISRKISSLNSSKISLKVKTMVLYLKVNKLLRKEKTR